VIKLFYRQTIR